MKKTKITKPIGRKESTLISRRVSSTNLNSNMINGLFKAAKKTKPKTLTTMNIQATKNVNKKLLSDISRQMTQQETLPNYTNVNGQWLPTVQAFPFVSPDPINGQRLPNALNNGLGSTMIPSASTSIPTGGTISLAQAESLIAENTGVNKFQGGTKGSLTPAEKRELATYLQRYVAEGAARGVDVVAMIRNKGGTIKLGLATGWGNGIGVGGGGAALFNRTWWNKTDTGRRMGLFFQEFSHALGFMMDSANPKYGFERGWMHGAVDASNASVYNKNFDMLFNDMKTYGLSGNKVVSMGATGGGMGVPAAGQGGSYQDFIDGFMGGFAGGTPGAGGNIFNITPPAPPPPPTITPPAPLTTMQPGQGLNGMMSNIQPDRGSPTLGLDTNPYTGGGGDGISGGALDSSIAGSTENFGSILSNIPASTGPMLQGLAGALL